MEEKFGYEDLAVWQKAVDLSIKIIDLADRVKAKQKHYRLIEQLEASACSVPLNIAEGKGRYSKKEFVQFLYIARGSLFEAVSLLEIFCLKGWITKKELQYTKTAGNEVGKMISGLVLSIKKSF